VSVEASTSGRQRQLLNLLAAVGGRIGNLDFQKLLFLYCQGTGVRAEYEFVPYKYGAFSFTSYADRRKLVERGVLAADEQHWELTAEGRKLAARWRSLSAGEFAAQYGRLRGDALVADTYRRFPYYASRSEIAGRVLRGDDAALRRIEEARTKHGRPLSTIGYEGRSLERYLNRLLLAGVSVLCDVRRNPISRKYGFSKSTLRAACQGVGLRYEHLPELGIESERRQDLNTQADYDALFAEYRKTLPRAQAALASIEGWMAAGERVALTCYEEAPQRCHRHCVAEALEKRAGGLTAQAL